MMFTPIKLPTSPSKLTFVGLNLGIVQLFTRGPYDDKAIFTDCSKYRSIENCVILENKTHQYFQLLISV